MTSLRRLLLVTACTWFALAGAGSALADEPERGFTTLADGILKRSDLVVVGRSAGVKQVRTQQIARLEVERVLFGAAPAGPLTVMVRGPKPTLDPDAPSAPVLPTSGEQRHVFFLAKRPDGVAFRFVDRMLANGLVGEEKIDSIAAEVKLFQIEDVNERARKTLAHQLNTLRAAGRWTRVHAARELHHLAFVRPDLFDAEVRRELKGLLRKRIPREQRGVLQQLVGLLDRQPVPAAPKDDRPAPTTVEKDPWKRAFLDAASPRQLAIVEALFAMPTGVDRERAFWVLANGKPAAREAAVHGFVALDARDQVERLLRAYANEDAIEVRTALVRAAGLLGGEKQVPWLMDRCESPRMERAALLALARIRTTSALAHLRRVHEALTGSDDVLRPSADWVAFLLSDDFPRSDAR